MPQSQRLADTPPELVIRAFQPGDESAFRALNEEWITRYFALEPKDEKIFADPKATILDPGGQILFALLDGRHVGCCALLRTSPTEFELSKLAVSQEHQGAGIGRKLFEAVIRYGRAAGATRLYLDTNHTLIPAIRLYESLGFRHIDPARITPSPYARTDVYMELVFA
jgi:GNAT superfamily N-acetyltransferase